MEWNVRQRETHAHTSACRRRLDVKTSETTNAFRAVRGFVLLFLNKGVASFSYDSHSPTERPTLSRCVPQSLGPSYDVNTTSPSPPPRRRAATPCTATLEPPFLVFIWTSSCHHHFPTSASFLWPTASTLNPIRYLGSLARWYVTRWYIIRYQLFTLFSTLHSRDHREEVHQQHHEENVPPAI